MKETRRNDLIFLTGCIKPGGMAFTKLQDPDIRRRQYIEAIRFYLSKTPIRILFIENTNTDISTEFRKEVAAGRIEMHTFDGNNYNKKLGKGYGEMLIIEYAVNNSCFFKNADFVYKITGRYKIINIQSFIKAFRRNRSINLFLERKEKFSFIDSRFWGADSSFLSNFLIKYKEKINDSEGFLFEHALFKAVQEAVSNNYKYSDLVYLPRISGVYGTKDIAFNDSWLFWLPRNVIHFLKYKIHKNSN